tara:strand:- start:2651 stop:2971 length:321 start_codon:yes stop_codon:yes gene_type:complete
MSNLFRIAFCQVTAPLCPDMQREVWRWISVLKKREKRERIIEIKKLAKAKKQNRVLEIEELLRSEENSDLSFELDTEIFRIMPYPEVVGSTIDIERVRARAILFSL